MVRAEAEARLVTSREYWYTSRGFAFHKRNCRSLDAFRRPEYRAAGDDDARVMHVKWREDLKFISEGLEPLLAVDQAGAHLKRRRWFWGVLSG